jgi:hypothetical protein
LGYQGTWVSLTVRAAIFFLSSPSSDRLVRVRRSRHEAAHSLPFSVEVMNAWMCTCSPPYVFMACSSIQRRSHLTFFAAEWFVARKHA